VKAIVSMREETSLCRSEKVEPCHDRDQNFFRVAVPFFKSVQKWFPGFASLQAIFSVHVVWVHFQLNGLSNESVHVSGFGRN
jgi:hypothetical protein